jgi:hypothetical protein
MTNSKRRFTRLVLALAAVGSMLAVVSSAASANLTFARAGVDLRAADGSQSRGAGAHPNFHFNVTFPEVNQVREGAVVHGPPESAKDVEIALPPGMYANPGAIATCSIDNFFNNGALWTSCPNSAQVGVANVVTVGTFASPEKGFKVGIFNLPHGPEVPALFGFKVATTLIQIIPHVRPGDYGITSGTVNTTQANALQSAEITFWGVPADPSHDTERVGEFEPNIDPGRAPIPATVPRVPFFTNPGDCSARSSFTASVNSWENPAAFDLRGLTTDEAGAPFVWEGCEGQPFESKLLAQPGTRRAGAPTGLDVNLSVTPSEGPDGRSAANVKRTVVDFPPGMTISAAAAAGLGSCSEAQVGLGTNGVPSCPDNSKIGSVSIKTQLLPEPLEGEVVLASQKANPFGSNFAVYVLAKGPGFWLKVPGELQADPQTGRLKAIFDNMPQLPFENVHLQLDGGANAPLVTPAACGTYSIRTEIFSWARPTEPLVASQPLVVDEGCGVGGFKPDLSAGVTNPVGGQNSPLTIDVRRNDGEQNLSQLEFVLPKGELASLKGVPLCPESAAPSGACPAGSQVGVLKAAIGTGSAPLQVPQPGKAPTALYLAGPYKGAPYSLVAKVPAQAGPFDLGTVTVRNALYIDPLTTQVTAKSDPLPQILEGVPITYSNVRVEVNRPDFAVNPTNCTEQSVRSKLTSAAGQVATPSVRYQVAGCAGLDFAPKLALSLKGAMKRSGNPALTAVLTQPKGGDANIAGTQVLLPKTMFIDNAHVNSPCTRVQFNAGACPPKSILGTAVAYTPLLDKPLEGPVYFRSNGGERELPDLVADLDGQIHVTLVGFIDSVKVGREGSRVRTRFQNVPDAPVSRFVLRLKGGKRGLIENSVDLCKVAPKAGVKLVGQNGKASEVTQAIGTTCGKSKHGSKSKKGK